MITPKRVIPWALFLSAALLILVVQSDWFPHFERRVIAGVALVCLVGGFLAPRFLD